MIRYLLVIPFALLIAIGSSSLFLLMASIIDPVLAMLSGDTLLVGFWRFVDEVVSSEDPGPIVSAAFVAVGRIVFTILVFPPLFVAVLSEVIRARGFLWYTLATGVLTAAIPWILRGSARIESPGELHVSFVLGLTGAVAGLVYWAIAGRDGRPAPSAPMSPES